MKVLTADNQDLDGIQSQASMPRAKRPRKLSAPRPNRQGMLLNFISINQAQLFPQGVV